MEGLIIETPALDVYEHMALDEEMALNPPGAFAVRFYNWKGGGATFGYAQNSGDVLRGLPPDRKDAPLARRPTGGGVVFHYSDLTFSCVYPNRELVRPAAVYAKFHGAIEAGLRERAIACGLCRETGPAGYAPSDGNGLASLCFKNPVPLDVVDAEGRKILGGAVRRFDGSVLYQGSLQAAGVREREPEFRLLILRSLAGEWSLKWSALKLSAPALERARRLADAKYRTREWLERF